MRFALANALRPLLLGRFVGIDLLLLQKLARHEIRIAAEQDVGTAAGHVGGDRDRTFAARLRDDLRFAFVILRVQNVVRDTASFCSRRAINSEFSTETVPTRAGWPRS